MFGIFSEDMPIEIEGELVQPAKIVINEFNEALRLPLSYWKLDDYKCSWLKSLKEGLLNKTHAALAVSMYEPEKVNFIFVWVIYFEDDVSYVQNSIIFLDELHGFNSDRINEYIDPRTTHDDGMRISEWETDLNSILVFFNDLEK